MLPTPEPMHRLPSTPRTARIPTPSRVRVPIGLLAFAFAAFPSTSPVAVASPPQPPPLFLKACAPCHGKDGRATTPAARKLGVKDLALSRLEVPEIERQLLEGRRGPDGSIKMPSFRETLKSSEIEALARFARTLQTPGASTNTPPPR